ncbi:hypothetical protein DRE_00145 [Drechslerella stenobrocha 248]|uniref:Uncharacterized protein n=1 Tax=Drechslerella stenobrocha 248 TaxID=1043628 RepID=W7IHT3_9PEZI|nr:hypothetical protein DRE_00145 [Drechslerella stenobrocha 248]
MPPSICLLGLLSSFAVDAYYFGKTNTETNPAVFGSESWKPEWRGPEFGGRCLPTLGTDGRLLAFGIINGAMKPGSLSVVGNDAQPMIFYQSTDCTVEGTKQFVVFVPRKEISYEPGTVDTYRGTQILDLHQVQGVDITTYQSYQELKPNPLGRLDQGELSQGWAWVGIASVPSNRAKAIPFNLDSANVFLPSKHADFGAVSIPDTTTASVLSLSLSKNALQPVFSRLRLSLREIAVNWKSRFMLLREEPIQREREPSAPDTGFSTYLGFYNPSLNKQMASAQLGDSLAYQQYRSQFKPLSQQQQQQIGIGMDAIDRSLQRQQNAQPNPGSVFNQLMGQLSNPMFGNQLLSPESGVMERPRVIPLPRPEVHDPGRSTVYLQSYHLNPIREEPSQLGAIDFGRPTTNYRPIANNPRPPTREEEEEPIETIVQQVDSPERDWASGAIEIPDERSLENPLPAWREIPTSPTLLEGQSHPPGWVPSQETSDMVDRALRMRYFAQPESIQGQDSSQQRPNTATDPDFSYLNVADTLNADPLEDLSAREEEIRHFPFLGDGTIVTETGKQQVDDDNIDLLDFSSLLPPHDLIRRPLYDVQGQFRSPAPRNPQAQQAMYINPNPNPEPGRQTNPNPMNQMNPMIGQDLEPIWRKELEEKLAGLEAAYQPAYAEVSLALQVEAEKKKLVSQDIAETATLLAAAAEDTMEYVVAEQQLAQMNRLLLRIEQEINNLIGHRRAMDERRSRLTNLWHTEYHDRVLDWNKRHNDF